ncbi:MAG: winged helix-turn-helix domain-containing protein, partial [Vicinamibacteria bacterium]
MPPSASRYSWDDFVLDTGAFRLERGGRPVPLEPKAVDVLALLVSQDGRLVTKQAIFDTVWRDVAVTDHALTRIVAQLRRALGDEARESRYIETVPTRGYRWIRPVTVETPAVSSPVTPATDGAREHGVPPAPAPVPGSTRPRVRPVWAAAALAVAVVVVAGTALVRRDLPSINAEAAPAWWKASSLIPAQLTTTPGLELHPAFSPDGRAVAVSRDVRGCFDPSCRELWVIGLEGQGDRAVPGTTGAYQPAWSPDGRLIAYHSYERGGILIVDARGGGAARQIVEEGSHPAWSPDGRHLAFQTDEIADVSPSAYGAQSGSVLSVVDADGGNRRALTALARPRGGHASPAWSPDGRWIAFSSFDAGPDSGLWVVSAEGGEPRQLSGGMGLYEPVFAPDGSALYAAGGEALIWRVPFDGARGDGAGDPVAMAVPSVPGVRGLSIAPDGSRLAFSGLTLRSHIWRVPIDGTRAAGDAAPVTVDTSRRNSLPVIAPDGSRVAYMSRPAGRPPAIWTVNLDGTMPAQLTPSDVLAAQPSWLPDGRRLAFLSNREPRTAIWTIDTTTRRESILVQGRDHLPVDGARAPARLGEIRLSPDGTAVAFSMHAADTGNRVMYVGDLEAGTVRRVTESSQWVGYPAWSPDGRLVAVEIKDGSSTDVGVIDVATGTLRQLTRARGQSWVRSWSPDGRRIAYAALRAGRWDLCWIDVQGGDEHPFAPPEPVHVYVRYPEW